LSIFSALYEPLVELFVGGFENNRHF
jgi:hypothetical protein